jgi:hypothetical protein
MMRRRLIAFALACSAATSVALIAGPVLSSDLGLPAEPAQGPVSRKAIFPRGEDTLVMMVCRKDASWRCELQEQIVEGLDMHPGTAFMQAQPLVQRWAESHPGYVVRHWRLRPGRGT